MGQHIMRQAAANALGISHQKLERLRKAGFLPEAVQIGHYYVFPVDKLPAIKERLIKQGKIKLPAVTATESA